MNKASGNTIPSYQPNSRRTCDNPKPLKSTHLPAPEISLKSPERPVEAISPLHSSARPLLPLPSPGAHTSRPHDFEGRHSQSAPPWGPARPFQTREEHELRQNMKPRTGVLGGQDRLFALTGRGERGRGKGEGGDGKGRKGGKGEKS